MLKQVDKSHYDFLKYVSKRRWASIWHQLDEIIKLKPHNVLEIGPGPGIFKALAALFDINVKTLDIAEDLEPDYLDSVLSMPFKDDDFDIVCAFQMLEHLPFELSLKAFTEMVRVAQGYVVISLPDSAIRWPISIHIPKIGVINFHVPKPRLRAKKHIFDGQHYWEINKAGYSLKKVRSSFLGVAPVNLIRTYRVHEFPYHRFFVFLVNKKKLQK